VYGTVSAFTTEIPQVSEAQIWAAPASNVSFPGELAMELMRVVQLPTDGAGGVVVSHTTVPKQNICTDGACEPALFGGGPWSK